MVYQEEIRRAADAEDKLARFETTILPHLDCAYNLARWLTRNDVDAQDIVQEAYLRALRFFSGFRGGDGRAWLLRIVRNTFYSWIEKKHPREMKTVSEEKALDFASDGPAPDARLLREADTVALRRAIEELPVEFREALVMRELEGLSYKEIADVANVPMGTVMSRLARARRLLRQTLLKDHGNV